MRARLTPRLIADIVGLIGFIVLAVGIGLIYLPAALIVIGVGLVMLALLFDDEQKKRRARR